MVETLVKDKWGRGVGSTGTGGQTGAVGNQDRECDARVLVEVSVASPVLLAHQGLCVWILT